jgi:hypothetical protein
MGRRRETAVCRKFTIFCDSSFFNLPLFQQSNLLRATSLSTFYFFLHIFSPAWPEEGTFVSFNMLLSWYRFVDINCVKGDLRNQGKQTRSTRKLSRWSIIEIENATGLWLLLFVLSASLQVEIFWPHRPRGVDSKVLGCSRARPGALGFWLKAALFMTLRVG